MSITKLVFPNLLDLAAAIAEHKNHTGYYLIAMKEQSLFVLSDFDGPSYVYEVPLSDLKYKQVKSGLNKSFNSPDTLEGFTKLVLATPNPYDFISLFNHSLRSEKVDFVLKPTP
ncbi:hypothetical protein [Hymenobacter siberiensis]|uniref:hypothetical protein n=1 Tax=Hymenobacter siberiensis TaxID=2848396 RepID=UPI001C1E5F6D|nr:hypothetical protein [Hymenobacter siberiensis]MBU6122598.1 hypothetical protein [Hymenobacter siberiensis]